MSDRKESLLRTLKLQNEQLEQWEHKRTIARDPDEERLCDNKIKDIKTLIAQHESELKKVKGNKQQVPEPDDAVKPVVNHLEQQHNEIGFNADRHFSENMVGDNLSDNYSLSKLGDDFDPREIRIDPPTNRAIRTVGTEPGSVNVDPEVFEKKKKFAIASSIVLAVGVFVISMIADRQHFFLIFQQSALLRILLFFAALIITGLIYRFVHFKLGLNFALSILVLCIYAGSIFWKVPLVGEKSTAEVVILPLLVITIGSVLLLLNDEMKK